MVTMEWGDPAFPESFWKWVYPEPITGCWLWGGAHNRTSGVVKINKKTYFVHLLIARTIFDNPDLHYTLVRRTCGNGNCIAPYHLAKLDFPECLNGHRKTPQNTDRFSSCRICKREQKAEARRAKGIPKRVYKEHQPVKRKQLSITTHKSKPKPSPSKPMVSVFGDKPPEKPWRPEAWRKMKGKESA